MIEYIMDSTTLCGAEVRESLAKLKLKVKDCSEDMAYRSAEFTSFV
jgi:hypothetical protein